MLPSVVSMVRTSASDGSMYVPRMVARSKPNASSGTAVGWGSGALTSGKKSAATFSPSPIALAWAVLQSTDTDKRWAG
jgi:hypothetical protein